ncbi:MAG: MtnX-like HAD-IB family phosphatase [Rhizobiales bacterium]|nr:MtnX-like HAD-IB family phosphatase [Hyphomicrobiales bacterium]OJY01377.1 MAG: hypothetical protein BGP07_11965 [Rhizobiales bacterium 63-22]
MQVYCDFDGTISLQDVTDHVLERLAGPQWEEIEALWAAGRIDSGTCMRQQVALIRASREELDRVLDTVKIDSGFANFAALCAAEHIPLTIVSDGVDYFIRHVLKRHGLDSIPVIANRLLVSQAAGETVYALASPYADSACRAASGVCKCKVVKASGPRIYVGDGRSDFCVSDQPEIVFAKSKLAAYCRQSGIAFLPYDSFGDVAQSLRSLLPALRAGIAA